MVSSQYEFLNQVREGIVILSREKEISFINTACKSFFSVEVGAELHTLFSSLDPELQREILTTIDETFQKKIPQEYTFKLASGRSFLLKTFPKRDQLVMIINDLSDEEAIQEFGREFIANASHELRTPITIIRGFAEMLNEMPEVSQAMLEDITEKIIRNCQRMSQLVKSLLLLADLDTAAPLEMASVELVDLVDQCSQILLNVHPEVCMEVLHNKEEIYIHGSIDLLERLIMNLLENGVKYSEHPASIQITIEKKEDEIVLSISDKGKGIPEKDIKRIFDRFYTVNKAHSRKLGGAGLGLSIVKKICHKHNADIEVQSKEGKGTTFRIYFPVPE